MKDGIVSFYRMLIVGVTVVWLAVMGIIVAYMSVRTLYCNMRLFIERINNDK
jgi:hypothetical protein